MKKLETLRNKFLWGAAPSEKKLIWAYNSKVYGDLSIGGLKVGSPKGKNLSLLGKWWWRFHMEQQSLWARVISSIYDPDGGLTVATTQCLAGPWAAIIKAGLNIDNQGVSFTQSFRRKLGDGSCIKFWTHQWLGAGKLCILFNRLFALEQDQESSVKDRLFMSNNSITGSWDWRRTPGGRETGELNFSNKFTCFGCSRGELDGFLLS